MVLKIQKMKMFSFNMQHVCKIIEEYNSSRKYNVSIVVDMIADMISYRKRNQNVLELFIYENKIYVLFLSHYLF